jgi:hypothetical protein
MYEEYILKGRLHNDVRILEIGAGSFGLAGLVCHKYVKSNNLIDKSLIQITDGNIECIPKLESNLILNKFVDFRKQSIKVSLP